MGAPMESSASKHFCTVVDQGYVCFLLALHQSLREHAPDWTMHVACLDDTSLSLLEELALDGLEPIAGRELEEIEPGLTVTREVKPFHDFVMACKPFLMRYLLDRRRIGAVTWIDADAMSFGPLDSLADLLVGASVLLAPQGLSPAFRWVEAKTGRFMGGMVSFSDDEEGRRALGWWADRCLYGGCPRTPDAHRFADQKYLQEIPGRFAGVGIVDDPTLRLAPGSLECHAISRGPTGPLVDEAPLLLYQYTGFRLLRSGGYGVTFPPWRVDAEQRELIYEPFFARVQAARRLVQGARPGFDAVLSPPPSATERAMAVGSHAKGVLHRTHHRLRSRSASDR